MISNWILRKILDSRYLMLYVSILVIELILIHNLSDLPPATGNWIDKSRQILDFQIPDDNFYGPGAAILMVPFSIVPNTEYLANIFYFIVGALGYWKITGYLNSPSSRFISRAALPLNVYLIWLVNSSQDTVFEFALLVWSVYFLVSRRYMWFVAVTFLLCQTRAGYWVFFLGVSITFFLLESFREKKLAWKRLVAIPLLTFASLFNFITYSSPSPALEGGMTAYFSYTKYHYLALPKMDMDVFLSGKDGAFSSLHGPTIPEGSSLSEINSIYQRAAIDSALENKKETVLGWMQKFDSYIFDVQKIPHLPGAYVLNQEAKTISIVNERLSWNLVLGNLLFMIYRTILLLAGLLSVGILMGSIIFRVESVRRDAKLLLLATPFIFGSIPGLLFYTETRFKIVSELVLVPLVVEIWALSARAGRHLRGGAAKI
jgi:hypothetical protein